MAKVTDPFAMTNVLSAAGLVAILINSCIVVRFGRRRVLLMGGFVFCGLFQIIIAIVYDKKPGQTSTGQVIVALSCLYMVAYNGMIGTFPPSPVALWRHAANKNSATYAWVAGGEMPSQRLRSYTFGMAAAVGFFGAWLTTFTAPYFINPDALGWGPKYGYIWFPSCVISCIWVYFFLPETKDRTLEEIDEMFEARVPARKFRTYKCVGRIAQVAKEHEDRPETSLTNEKVRNPSASGVAV